MQREQFDAPGQELVLLDGVDGGFREYARIHLGSTVGAWQVLDQSEALVLHHGEVTLAVDVPAGAERWRIAH